jgi:myo-inositol catabolism protein IolS
MEYRSISGTDLSLSVIGTGCWSFGGGEYWGNQDQKDVTDVVHASVAHGINYFDTAEVYNDGRSEISLGEAIKGIPRDRLIIGSKISPSNTYPGKLEKHCEASLKRLNTDYIDIYMVHWPIHPHSIRHFTKDESVIAAPPVAADAFGALVKLREQGKIRHIGVSNFSFRRLSQDIPAGTGVAVNELPYNLLCRAIEYDTLPYCQDHGIGTIGYMTLLQGLLSRIFSSVEDIPEWRKRTRHFNCKSTPLCRHGEEGFEAETQEALMAVDRIARMSGMTMAGLATKWVLESGITCALVGARNLAQLEQNVQAAGLKVDAGVITQLNEATNHLKSLMGNHFDYYESKENDRTR